MTARGILLAEGFTEGVEVDTALGVGWGESEGFVDAVGDYDITGIDSRGVDWGISGGWFQIRTLRSPKMYAIYDRVRDIGHLAGRDAGVELAPNTSLLEAAARAQARATLILVRARGWGLWSVHPDSGKDPTGKYVRFNEGYGKDYPLRLGHRERSRWNLKGEVR